MRIEVTDAEMDYLYRLCIARPMVEVEPLVLKLRVQITRQQGPAQGEGPAEGPQGAAKRGNGAAEGDDGLPLP
ncbi:MAG TPA: hypothetical protein VK955_04625 [Xanthobacteraceae bacterium]|nr:hypothetical protein [Xanthobacteraceae bacterium]